MTPPIARSVSKRTSPPSEPEPWLAPTNARSTSTLEMPSQTTAGQVLCLRKRLVEIGDDVAGILAPHRQAQETG